MERAHQPDIGHAVEEGRGKVSSPSQVEMALFGISFWSEPADQGLQGELILAEREIHGVSFPVPTGAALVGALWSHRIYQPVYFCS